MQYLFLFWKYIGSLQVKTEKWWYFHLNSAKHLRKILASWYDMDGKASRLDCDCLAYFRLCPRAALEGEQWYSAVVCMEYLKFCKNKMGGFFSISVRQSCLGQHSFSQSLNLKKIELLKWDILQLWFFIFFYFAVCSASLWLLKSSWRWH